MFWSKNTLWGFDYANDGLRAVLLEQRGQQLNVLKSFYDPHTHRLTQIPDFIKKGFDSCFKKSMKIALAAQDDWVYQEVLTIPAMLEGDDLEALVRLILQEKMGQDDIYYDYCIQEASDAHQQVNTYCMLQKHLKEGTGFIQQHFAVIQAIDVASLAKKRAQSWQKKESRFELDGSFETAIGLALRVML